MRTTEFESNHKINVCVKNAYRAIVNGYAVDSIWKAYKRPSHYKINAWEWCRADCRENGGIGLCVTSWYTSKFTCAYFCKHHNTGKQCLVVHTADNVYWCFVSELQ